MCGAAGPAGGAPGAPARGAPAASRRRAAAAAALRAAAAAAAAPAAGKLLRLRRVLGRQHAQLRARPRISAPAGRRGEPWTARARPRPRCGARPPRVAPQAAHAGLGRAAARASVVRSALSESPAAPSSSSSRYGLSGRSLARSAPAVAAVQRQGACGACHDRHSSDACPRTCTPNCYSIATGLRAEATFHLDLVCPKICSRTRQTLLLLTVMLDAGNDITARGSCMASTPREHAPPEQVPRKRAGAAQQSMQCASPHSPPTAAPGSVRALAQHRSPHCCPCTLSRGAAGRELAQHPQRDPTHRRTGPARRSNAPGEPRTRQRIWQSAGSSLHPDPTLRWRIGRCSRARPGTPTFTTSSSSETTSTARSSP